MQLHVALLNVLLIVKSNALGSTFTIEPTTQHVFIGQTATFECATNNGTLILSVSGVSGTVSPPIDLPEGGQHGTATFTVTAANNGSAIVTCLAQPQGSVVFIPSATVTAYAQAISSPSSIEANQTDPCTITVQWKEPFLLPGLSVSYTVSVYLVDTVVSVHNVSTTTFTYHPTTGSGVYTIQVRAFNGTLTGDATNTTVDVGTRATAIDDSRNAAIDNEIWIYQFHLSDLCSLVPTNVMAISCTVDDTCYNTSNVTMDNDGTITANYTGLPDDAMFNTSVLLGYDVDSGDIIQITNNVTTSTYSVQNVTLLNETAKEFCVEYYLVKGTNEHMVDAAIKCDSLGLHKLQPMNIEASTEVCYSGIAANTWTLYGCDGGSISCDSSNAAVSITDIVVTGASTSATPTVTPTAISTSPTMSVSSTGTPSISLSDSNSSVPVPLVAGSVVGVIVICLITIIIIIVIVLAAVYKLKRNEKKSDACVSHNHDSGAVLLGNIVFDGKPPPSNGAYTEVVLATTLPQQQNTLLYADIGIKPSVNPISQDDAVLYAGIQGTVYPKCPETFQSKTIDHPPTQMELIAVLVPGLSAKWHAIGLALGLSPQQLKEVQDNRPDDRDGCLKDVLIMWEDNATDDKPYTWATMLHVLRSGKIGDKGFANYLQQHFMS